METIIENKVNTKKLKETIKVAAEYQRFLKNQRKTKNLVGKREIPPSEATWKHQMNREKLRIMYAAYGLMRGKRFSQIENNYSEGGHPLHEFKIKIDKLILEYMYEEVEKI